MSKQISSPGRLRTSLVRVPPHAIQEGPIQFDLYARIRGNMVLFCRGGFSIQGRHIEALERLDLKLFVDTYNWDDFLEYAHPTLERVISDNSVDIVERSRLLTDYSRKRIGEILTSPMMEHVPEEAQSIASLYTKLIQSSPEAVASLFALASIDDYNVSHAINACTLNILIAGLCLDLNQKSLEEIGVAGLLHDLGKVRIDSKILLKEGKLDLSEYEAIKLHTVEGEKIMQRHNVSGLVKLTARSHHERIDGSGYPDGLRWAEIHPFARITAVSDVYDALTSQRVYKDELSAVQALKIILKDSHQFDPDALNALVQISTRNSIQVESLKKRIFELDAVPATTVFK